MKGAKGAKKVKEGVKRGEENDIDIASGAVWSGLSKVGGTSEREVMKNMFTEKHVYPPCPGFYQGKGRLHIVPAD